MSAVSTGFVHSVVGIDFHGDGIDIITFSILLHFHVAFSPCADLPAVQGFKYPFTFAADSLVVHSAVCCRIVCSTPSCLLPICLFYVIISVYHLITRAEDEFWQTARVLENIIHCWRKSCGLADCTICRRFFFGSQLCLQWACSQGYRDSCRSCGAEYRHVPTDIACPGQIDVSDKQSG